MRRKWICMLLVATIIGILFAGCTDPMATPGNGPAPKPTQSPTQGPTQLPTQEPTQAPTQAPTDAQEEYVFQLVAGNAEMTQYQDAWTWYAQISVAKGEEIPVVNKADGRVWGTVTAKSAGDRLLVVRFEKDDQGQPRLVGDIVLEKLYYYVVGTCGNGGWDADATASNINYQMIHEGGKYVLDAAFTREDAGEDGKVAFKVAWGAGGVVLKWYGNASGENIVVDPGNHTVTFDPVASSVTMG